MGTLLHLIHIVDGDDPEFELPRVLSQAYESALYGGALLRGISSRLQVIA